LVRNDIDCNNYFDWLSVRLADTAKEERRLNFLPRTNMNKHEQRQDVGLKVREGAVQKEFFTTEDTEFHGGNYDFRIKTSV